MEDKVSSRQIGIIYLYASIALKLLFLPSILYQDSNSNALITLIFLFTINYLFIFLILKFINKFPNQSFYSVLSNKLNKFIAKIVMISIFLIYFIKFVILSNECYLFFRESVFMEARLILFVSIFLTIAICLAFSSIRAFGRTSEFFYIIILIGLILTFIVGYTSNKFALYNVIIEYRLDKTITSTFNKLAWFFDPLFLLMFMEHIKQDKNTKKYLLKYFWISCLIIFSLYLCFYALYGVNSNIHMFAVMDIVVFSTRNVIMGRFDIIPLITMMFLCTFQGAIFLKTSIRSLSFFVNEKKEKGCLIFTSLLYLVFVYKIIHNMETGYNILNKGVLYLTEFLAVFLFITIIYFIYKERERKKKYV